MISDPSSISLGRRVKKPACASPCGKSVANSMPRPSNVTVRLSITESEAAKIGILDRFRKTLARRQARNAKKQGLTTGFESLLKELFHAAENRFAAEHPGKPFTGRKFAETVRIPNRTLRRLRSANNPALIARWLPKIQAALAKLHS